MWKYWLALTVVVVVTAGAYGEPECRDRAYPCPIDFVGEGFCPRPQKGSPTMRERTDALDYQAQKGFPTIKVDGGKAWFDSLNVRFVGNWPFGPSWAVAYDSTRRLAFLGSGGGVHILDLSAPANPMKVSDAIRTRGVVRGLFYSSADSILYIAAGVAGLDVWDISDQNLPVKLGGCDTPGGAYGVAVSGSYAYIADGRSGLRVIDISDPTSPFEAGSRDTPGYARDVAVSGSYAYIADGDAGLRVIDISDPSAPFEAGFYDIPGSARDVAVSGTLAYIADRFTGLRVIDISDPSAPFEVGSYDTPGGVRDVAVSGSYAYIADHGAGLRVIDISDPSAPFEAGFYDTPGWAFGVAVSGSYAYIADGWAGLQIYQNLLVGVEETVLTGGGARVLQNPIPGDYIYLSFELPQSDNISFSLYNIAGQRLKSFSPSPLSPGSHTVRLPIDELSNGIYFMRIKGMTLKETIKLIRVR